MAIEQNASSRAQIAPITPPAGWPAGATAVVYPSTVLDPKAAAPNHVGELKAHEWSSDLFSCFDSVVPNTLMSFCCPLIAHAQIYARMGIASFRASIFLLWLLAASGVLVHYVPIERKPKTGSSTNHPTSLTGSTWHWFLIIQHLVLLSTIVFARRRARSRFHISGDICIDVCSSCLCPCCTIAQIATHVRSYKRGSCAFAAPDELPGFL